MKKSLFVFRMLIIGLSSSLMNAQTNVSGRISTDTTWTLANSPYIVTGNILVDTGVTLIIEPGVIVKFNSKLSMQINGTLLAKGTSSNKITFTSNTTQTAGAWGYIYFSELSADAVYENDIHGEYLTGNLLEYCIIEYAGGSNVSDNGALRLKTHPFINHCNISNNSATGVNSFGAEGNFKICNSVIELNPSGICVCAAYYGSTMIHYNVIRKNKTGEFGGIYITTDYKGSIIVSNNLVMSNSFGISCDVLSNDSYIYIYNNIIMGNYAPNTGGGIGAEGYNTNIYNNLVIFNTSDYVAGISGGNSIHNNIIADNISYSNCAGYNSNRGITTTFSKNQIIRNAAKNNVAIMLYQYNNDNIIHNTIAFNKGTDTANFQDRDIYSRMSSPILSYNNIFDNAVDYELFLGYAGGANAAHNWWGTSDDQEIQNKIFDWFDYDQDSIVNYSSYLTSPDTIAPISPPVNVTKKNLDGGQVRVTWKHNPETDIAGYHIYHGSFTGYSFTNVINVGNDTSYILAGFPITDTIAVTAYDRTYSPANELDSTIVKDNMINGNESWYAYAVDTSSATGISAHDNEIPKMYTLLQNYPNPFNPSTYISFTLPYRSQVSLKVYDILGKEVATLVNEVKSAGSYTNQWYASQFASGVYFYRLTAGSFFETKKLLLLK
jgi:hypothetical protein